VNVKKAGPTDRHNDANSPLSHFFFQILIKHEWYREIFENITSFLYKFFIDEVQTERGMDIMNPTVEFHNFFTQL
jgi:hypothetical protein